MEMKPPKTEKEIREFLGRIQYKSKFIAQLTMTCEPLSNCSRKKFPWCGMNNAKKLLRRLRVI